jgi:hypothetical protein
MEAFRRRVLEERTIRSFAISVSHAASLLSAKSIELVDIFISRAVMGKWA